MLIQRHPNSHYDFVLLNGMAWGAGGGGPQIKLALLSSSPFMMSSSYEEEENEMLSSVLELLSVE